MAEGISPHCHAVVHQLFRDRALVHLRTVQNLLRMRERYGPQRLEAACALGHQACRDGYHVLYQRLPRLLSDLEIAHADGRHSKLLQRLAKINVLVLDD